MTMAMSIFMFLLFPKKICTIAWAWTLKFDFPKVASIGNSVRRALKITALPKGKWE